MRYLGGKSRIAKHLAAKIDAVRRPGQEVWDAFCGGLSVSVALSDKGPVFATDACVPLIVTYKAIQSGWDPPTEVTLDEYRRARTLPDTDPMKAFCGFGCSFGGRYFEGYARGGGSYAQTTRRVLKKQLATGLDIDRLDFLSVRPQPCDSILYLDPPYEGTKAYSGMPRMDRSRFVDRVSEWGRHTHVFISEYDFPLGEVVFEIPKAKTVAGGSGGGRVGLERLYYLGPDKSYWLATFKEMLRAGSRTAEAA